MSSSKLCSMALLTRLSDYPAERRFMVYFTALTFMWASTFVQGFIRFGGITRLIGSEPPNNLGRKIISGHKLMLRIDPEGVRDGAKSPGRKFDLLAVFLSFCAPFVFTSHSSIVFTHYQKKEFIKYLFLRHLRHS